MNSTDQIPLSKLQNMLATLLDSPKHTQSSIAEDIGVDQSIISRFLNGNHKRRTVNIRKIQDYVFMHKNGAEIPESILSEARIFLRSGGTAEVLEKQIQLLNETKRL